MEFLKEVLGEELYNQMAEKINAHNGNEANLTFCFFKSFIYVF